MSWKKKLELPNSKNTTGFNKNFKKARFLVDKSVGMKDSNFLTRILNLREMGIQRARRGNLKAGIVTICSNRVCKPYQSPSDQVDVLEILES